MSGEGSLFDVPPAAIGRFRVLHQVGAGTSGPVFRAVDPDTNSPLAIKLVRLSLPPERISSIAAALEALAGDLPLADAICPVVEAGVHGVSPYLVTPFAPGDSLDVALKQFGPAALVDLVPRLRLLGGALDAAAARGIVHGALHPRDVLVSESATWITGLGVWPILSRHGERLPARRPYRAPELADGAVSAAGDRFALAALAYEWMTGRRAPSTFVAGDMATLPGVDRAALGAVFARALHANPEQRDASCLEFVDALEAIVGAEESNGATAARPEARPRRRGSRAAQKPSLPLDAFPAEHQADRSPVPGDEALSMAAATAADADPVERIDVRETDAPEPSALETDSMQRPAVPLDGRLTEPSGSSLFGVTNDSPGAVTSGVQWGALAAGVAIGLLAGMAAGFLVWGRADGGLRPDRTSASPAAASADTPLEAPAPSPPAAVAADASQATPSAEPSAAGANPATSSPAAPVPSTTEGTAAVTPAPSLSAAPAPTAGNLLVRSTPPGATVFVDGTRRGITPLTLQNVALGTRRLRVQRDGFEPEDRQITLTASRPSRSLDVGLTRAAAPARAAAAAVGTAQARTGTLVVDSRPPGAAVLLNGRRVGVTPMTIDDLEPGSYTVELQLPAHRAVTTTVRVAAGTRARAAASLERVQEQP